MIATDLPSTVLSDGAPAPAAATTTHQIGPMLRQRRKALNLTLAQVAERVGIATGFLSEIERDQASPSVATLIRLFEPQQKPGLPDAVRDHPAAALNATS